MNFLNHFHSNIFQKCQNERNNLSRRQPVANNQFELESVKLGAIVTSTANIRGDTQVNIPQPHSEILQIINITQFTRIRHGKEKNELIKRRLLCVTT